MNDGDHTIVRQRIAGRSVRAVAKAQGRSVAAAQKKPTRLPINSPRAA
jgi:hypothetical protein